MSRLVVISMVTLLTLALAPFTSGATPTVERSQTDYEFTRPAGWLCDFDYHQTIRVTETMLIFGDPDAPSKVIFQDEGTVSHENLATGYTLTETIGGTTTIDLVSGTQTTVGIWWHLRAPDGRLVVVQAGRLVFSYDTGAVISYTPNTDPEFAAVICPALGGSPA